MKKVQNLSAVLLFSIAYGCLVGSIGTPSGGGRNVIMIDYLRSSNSSISYIDWMIRIYPLVLIQIPIVSWVLIKSFPPEYSQLDSGVRKLVIQVAKSGGTHRKEYSCCIYIFIGFFGVDIF